MQTEAGKTILIVEDEEKIARFLELELKHEGYQVLKAFTGRDGLALAESGRADLMVLDVMLPELNGFEVLKRMRRLKLEIPVLFLTARDRVEDIVFGLNSGADDYMVKPFSFDELLARIRVITRRNPEVRENIYQCGDLVINCNDRSVTRQGKEIALSPKEYAVLEYLARNKNVALTRSQIESNIWDMDYDNESNVIDVYIRYLRKKIDDDYEEKLIQTVRGVGYMLKCEK